LHSYTYNYKASALLLAQEFGLVTPDPLPNRSHLATDWRSIRHCSNRRRKVGGQGSKVKRWEGRRKGRTERTVSRVGGEDRERGGEDREE